MITRLRSLSLSVSLMGAPAEQAPMRRLRIIPAVLGLVVMVSASCRSSPEDAIVGKWLHLTTSTPGGIQPFYRGVREFFKDGTVVLTQAGESYTGDYRFIDETRLRTDLGFVGSFVDDISLSDSEFTLTDARGEVTKLHKVDQSLAVRLIGSWQVRVQFMNPANPSQKADPPGGPADTTDVWVIMADGRLTLNGTETAVLWSADGTLFWKDNETRIVYIYSMTLARNVVTLTLKEALSSFDFDGDGNWEAATWVWEFRRR